MSALPHSDGCDCGLFGSKGWKRQSQYDAHSQVIVRLTDEDGRPIEDYDIFFDSTARTGSDTMIADLIEHTHRNGSTPKVLVFYPRVDKFDGSCGRTVSTISSP
jgi:hypothetical protein